jgi:hypothetical protein
LSELSFKFASVSSIGAAKSSNASFAHPCDLAPTCGVRRDS